MRNYKDMNISLYAYHDTLNTFRSYYFNIRVVETAENNENRSGSWNVWQQSLKNMNLMSLLVFQYTNAKNNKSSKKHIIVFKHNCWLWTSKCLQNVIDLLFFIDFKFIPISVSRCRKWAIFCGSGPPQHAREVRTTWVLTSSSKLRAYRQSYFHLFPWHS